MFGCIPPYTRDPAADTFGLAAKYVGIERSSLVLRPTHETEHFYFAANPLQKQTQTKKTQRFIFVDVCITRRVGGWLHGVFSENVCHNTKGIE